MTFLILQENIRLKRCNLAWNGFGPEGGLHIADVIANNQALLDLDITGNRLDFNTALAIAKSLRRNEELHVLKVRSSTLRGGCGII